MTVFRGVLLRLVSIQTLVAVKFSDDLPMMGRKSIVIFYFGSEIFAFTTS